MPNLNDLQDKINYKVRDIKYFIDGSFKSKRLDDRNITLVMGKRIGDDDGAMVVQSIDFNKPDWNISEVNKWVDSHKDQFEVEPDKLFSIKDVEIFSSGKWNGHDITDSDLDNIVDAFHKINAKPSLKLGHCDDQEILKVSGMPSAGWVDNVRRAGSKIVADFVDMPKKIFQLVKNKAYRKVSCEIFNNVDYEGNKYPRMLGAVALLGSELPGVLNLNDMLSLYSKESLNFNATMFASNESTDIIKEEIYSEEPKQMADENIEKLKFQLEAAETAKNEAAKSLEEAQKEAKELKDKFSLVEQEKKKSDEALADAVKREKAAQLDKFVTELTAEKLISKSMVEPVKELLGDDKEKYSIKVKDEDKELTKHELLKHLFSLAKETAKVNFNDETGDLEEPSKTLEVDHVEKYAKENDITFTEAYKALQKTQG